MPDVSIAVSVRNNASRELGNISRSAETLENDIEALGRELDSLRNRRVSVRMDLDDARRELREARNAFDGTEESIQRLQNAYLNVDNITEQLRDVSQAARNAQRDLASADDELSRSRAGGGVAGGVDIGSESTGSTSSLISRLGEAGAWAYAGDILSNTSQAVVSSAYGSNAGTMFGSVVSGATSGAAIGSMVAPGIGTAVGAGLGAIGGVITGGTQIFQEKDDAFKDYVQDRTETLLAAEQQSIENGSSIAAQREKDLISFNTLFGDEQIAKNYLKDLQTAASETPFQYDELTNISKTFASYGLGVEHMLPTIQKIGDAGAALGMETYDMGEIATSLGRMYQGGTVTRELLDVIDDRGINATQMLADAYGVSYGAMLEMISDSKIESQKAFEIILNGIDAAYNGAAKLQGLTFDGLTSTLQDLQTQADAAYGQGFNDTRKVGLEEQIDFEKENAAALEKVNYAIGVYYAELENGKEDLIRQYQSDIINSEDFQNANTTEEYVTIAEKLMEAESAALDEYNATIGKDIVDKQISLANSVAENASANEAAWNAGYRIGQQYSKGLAAAVKSAWATALANTDTPSIESSVKSNTNTIKAKSNGAGSFSSMTYAFGLDRVPYDDYPALLHEGERVLTANQARQMDNQKSIQNDRLLAMRENQSYLNNITPIEPRNNAQEQVPSNNNQSYNITINMGGVTVREDADIDRIAAALAQNLKIAKAVQK